MRTAAAAIGLAASLFAASSVAVSRASAADTGGPRPWSIVSFARDVTGSTVSDIALESGQLPLMAVGGTYKLADLSYDVGKAALEHKDRYYDAELVLIGQDAARLKAIATSGGDLGGDEAAAIRARLSAAKYDLERPGRSPFGYTPAVLVEEMPYAVVKVGLDKLTERAFGYAVGKLAAWTAPPLRRLLGVKTWPSLPEPIRWAMKNRGPLASLERQAGWTKLGERAFAAQAAADKAFEAEAVKAELGATRAEDLSGLAADALAGIYRRTLLEHPSAPRTVQVSYFRLAAAQAAIVPTAALAIAAAPAPAIVAAAPAVAVMAPARADPVIRAIRNDDPPRWRSTDAAPSEPEDRSSSTSSDGETSGGCRIGCNGGPTISGGPDGSATGTWFSRF